MCSSELGRKLPELKIRAFSGSGKDYTVQQFLSQVGLRSRALSLDRTLFGTYSSLEQQKVETRTMCLEGAALEWAMQAGGKFTTVATWDEALAREFTHMTSAQARHELYSLRCATGDVGEHDAQFRRLSALVEGLFQQEATTAAPFPNSHFIIPCKVF